MRRIITQAHIGWILQSENNRFAVLINGIILHRYSERLTRYARIKCQCPLRNSKVCTATRCCASRYDVVNVYLCPGRRRKFDGYRNISGIFRYRIFCCCKTYCRGNIIIGNCIRMCLVRPKCRVTRIGYRHNKCLVRFIKRIIHNCCKDGLGRHSRRKRQNI